MVKQKGNKHCAVAALAYLTGLSYTQVLRLRTLAGQRGCRAGTPLHVCEGIMARCGVWEEVAWGDNLLLNTFRIRAPFGAYFVAARMVYNGQSVCHAMVYQDGKLRDPSRNPIPARLWLEHGQLLAAWKLVQSHTVVGCGEIRTDRWGIS